MSNYTITHEIVMVTEECYSCGIPFAIDKNFQASLIKTHNRFYCPNGHAQYYTENATERKLKDAENRLESERQNSAFWRNEAESTQRSLSATKGVLTKTKKRIANGVCPCCHRQFVNLQRHMSGQHPDFTIQP